MHFLTEDLVIVCQHQTGHVDVPPSQDWVTIESRRVIIEPDPEGRPISGCLNFNPAAGIRPCKTTLPVRAGYSEWIKIDGHRVSLDSVVGFTDGTPPRIVDYIVRAPGQCLVSEIP